MRSVLRFGVTCLIFAVAAMSSTITAQDQPTVADPAAVFADPPSQPPAAFSMTPLTPAAAQPSPAMSRFLPGPGQAAHLGTLGIGHAKAETYKILRYDEDYSYLRDPGKRTDYLDPLKYIPLNDRGDYYVSFGGETRQWFESMQNESFGEAPPGRSADNTVFLQRYMLHADVHMGDTWRVFVQSISGQEEGRAGGPTPGVEVDEFDVHQAFVDRTSKFSDSNSWTWRVGRQELRYGTGRLIDVREGPNLRLSFDAVRALTRFNNWSIDGWLGKPVQNNPGIFDDAPSSTLSFWGLYGTGPVVNQNALSIDLYYLGFQNQQAHFNEMSGAELRHSIGSRIWGRPQQWEYNLEYVYQFGTFGSGSISAWTAANAARYNFVDYLFKPATGARFDVASGDQNANSQNLQTFNPMFPSGAYFNLANPFGPYNMIDLHPTLDLRLKDNLQLSADWNFFWRESLHDGVYRLNGSLLASGKASNARYIGSSPAITAVWTPRTHVTILLSYVHVFPGQFIIDATPGKPIDYVTGWLTFKF